MPYGSYHEDEAQAVKNAVRFMKESGAEAVKIEGGRTELVKRLLDAEVPVMGHIGLTPQSLHKMGGFKVQGKTLAAVEKLMKDAVALDRAGVFSLVLEGIPREVGAMITAEVNTATIGIGAGPDCDGQVLVLHDILNLSFGEAPKFVRRYADLAGQISTAVNSFKNEVEAGVFPSEDESYHLPKETQSALETISERKRAMRR
jgi:3-methyl-2-oxobutanoate hydroxymethyltransferase